MTAAGLAWDELALETRVQRRRFASMGVEIECLLDAERPDEALFDEVEREFARLEAIFTRFRPESELSELNRLGTLRCSPEMIEVLERAVRARDETGGRFDPAVHDALVAAGYDRTFADVAPDARGPDPGASPCGGEISIDAAAGIVSLGTGVRIDLGGIVKGFAAERGCDMLGAAGPCLVNAAGDLAVRGTPPEGVWPVAVELPAGPLTLGLRSGGLATSGRDQRRWRRNGRELHHIIDPATGRPAVTDLLSVTAFGCDAVEAEVCAKALFLAGEAAAIAEADGLGIPCVLVTEDARIVEAGGLA